ncbi:MAG TPA: NAD(P)H-dependent glycerol-3-phosphate dehydrogenase [Rhodoblastus sp.]|nr:NAD(P)-dependent glycerol-3-phosphate dehydrogenase [Rhodoblastus sp.]HPG02260.1 NAD(P)H-dependent glycerol-3-phosphate dehydrogenase [Rhodoblastus sp.]
MSAQIVVLGAGAFGTALANQAAHNGARVILWARDKGHVTEMQEARENARRLPGVTLAPSVEPGSDLACLRDADVVLAATPAQALREIARAAAAFSREGADWLICAKGIERGTHAFLSDIVAAELPGANASVLSGPSFAEDIAAGLPTAITLAAPDADRAERLGRLFDSPAFRLYRSTDVRGAEIGGAAKNVLAIACGIAAGRKLGASAVAALTARGFAELSRFGRAFGAHPETLMGLSGLGDLVLTCSSLQSRNFAFGHALGRGLSLAEAAGGKLAEGAFTARALVELAAERNVEMPICAVVDAIVSGQVGVDAAIESLLMRPKKSEV